MYKYWNGIKNEYDNRLFVNNVKGKCFILRKVNISFRLSIIKEYIKKNIYWVGRSKEKP